MFQAKTRSIRRVVLCNRTVQSAISLESVPQLLYLAIPATDYARFMAQQAIRLTLESAKIKLILVDLSREEITQWIH